jgi:hypothetical protein
MTADHVVAFAAFVMSQTSWENITSRKKVFFSFLSSQLFFHNNMSKRQEIVSDSSTTSHSALKLIAINLQNDSLSNRMFFYLSFALILQNDYL